MKTQRSARGMWMQCAPACNGQIMHDALYIYSKSLLGDKRIKTSKSNYQRSALRKPQSRSALVSKVFLSRLSLTTVCRRTHRSHAPPAPLSAGLGLQSLLPRLRPTLEHNRSSESDCMPATPRSTCQKRCPPPRQRDLNISADRQIKHKSREGEIAPAKGSR